MQHYDCNHHKHQASHRQSKTQIAPSKHDSHDRPPYQSSSGRTWWRLVETLLYRGYVLGHRALSIVPPKVRVAFDRVRLQRAKEIVCLTVVVADCGSSVERTACYQPEPMLSAVTL
jgi:hypothetical protein